MMNLPKCKDGKEEYRFSQVVYHSSSSKELFYKHIARLSDVKHICTIYNAHLKTTVEHDEIECADCDVLIFL